MEWLRTVSEKLLEITHGRSTAFFLGFFLSGNALAIAGKLTPVYVAYMATLGGLVLGHSIQENVLVAKSGPPAVNGTPPGGS